MSYLRCSLCGFVAAFGTAEQRVAEIRNHPCLFTIHANAFRAHPSNPSWMPPGGAA